MGGILVATVLILVVAAGVIVAASMWGDESGALRGLWDDLKAVIRSRRRRGAAGRAGAGGAVDSSAVDGGTIGGTADATAGVPARAVPAATGSAAVDDTPVDVPFAEIFARDADTEDGYLHLDELAELVERTGERAGRLLHVQHHGAEVAAQSSRGHDPRG